VTTIVAVTPITVSAASQRNAKWHTTSTSRAAAAVDSRARRSPACGEPRWRMARRGKGGGWIAVGQGNRHGDHRLAGRLIVARRGAPPAMAQRIRRHRKNRHGEETLVRGVGRLERVEGHTPWRDNGASARERRATNQPIRIGSTPKWPISAVNARRRFHGQELPRQHEQTDLALRLA